MPQSKRQKAIIIDIKNRLNANEKSLSSAKENQEKLKGSGAMFKGLVIEKKIERREFLQKKLEQAEMGKSVFKKNLTVSAQHLEWDNGTNR